MSVKVMSHIFVDHFPERLKAGELYLAMEFSTAVHLCACGCGQKVFTPFSPTDWQMIFDGETISFKPSIGNWTFPCRSHYWIRNSAIVWAGDMSEERIKLGRLQDKRAKAQREANMKNIEHLDSKFYPNTIPKENNGLHSKNIFKKFKSWLGL